MVAGRGHRVEVDRGTDLGLRAAQLGGDVEQTALVVIDQDQSARLERDEDLAQIRRQGIPVLKLFPRDFDAADPPLVGFADHQCQGADRCTSILPYS